MLAVVIISIFALIMIYIIYKNVRFNIKQKKKAEQEKKKAQEEKAKPEIVETKPDGKVVVQQKVIPNTKSAVNNVSWNEAEEAAKHLTVLQKQENMKNKKNTEFTKAKEILEEKEPEETSKDSLDKLNDLTPEMKTIILSDILNNKKF